MTNIEKLADANVLIDSFNKAKKGSIWKYSVQKYEVNLLKNTRQLQKDLLSGNYRQGNFLEFELNERGHNRRIKALGVADRVVQRGLCDEILLPTFRKYLIYDNGASLKNRGIHFSRQRLEKHLHSFYRKHGNNGYILHIDFRKFFDNIPHDKLIAAFDSKFEDKTIMPVLEHMIRSFEVDISYADHDLSNEVFNSLEYAKIPEELKTGERFMGKSMGIGSQISQVAGIYFPSRIDTYCKVVKGCKYYGRYMDDIYIIHQDKEFLKQLLVEVEAEATKLGLFLNKKKTQIDKLSHGFTFLKVKYNLTETGKLIKRPARVNIARQRKKMKKFQHLVAEGRMTEKDVKDEFKSWVGGLKRLNSYRTLQSMTELYYALFEPTFIPEEK